MDASKFSISKLNNENYQTWQFKTKMFLIREDLWKYVEPGTPPDPVTTAWSNADLKALATISLLVDDNQVNTIINAKTAKEVWTSLQTVHHRATLSSKVALLKAICNKNFAHGGNMENHLFEMEDLFGKLTNAGQVLDENLKVAMILRSLPDSFNALTTALEARSDAELTLQLIRPKLIDEARKDMTPPVVEVAMKTEQMTCFYCNLPGHIIKHCKKFQASQGQQNHQSQQNLQRNDGFRKKKHGARNVSGDNDDNSKQFTLMVKESEVTKRSWIVDSGATSHMCSDKGSFVDISEESSATVVLANGKEVPVKGIGSVKIRTVDEEGSFVDLTLTKVLHVPDLESNLLSVSKLISLNVLVTFDRAGCKMTKSGVSLGVADRFGSLFKLRMAHDRASHVKSAHMIDCQHVWHKRFGHRDPTVINEILKNDLAIGLKARDCGIHEKCVSCLKGKLARQPFPKKSESKSKAVLDLVHTDVCGPIEPQTPSGTRYFMTMIDDYSRYTKTYFLKKKSEVAGNIRKFVRETETQFGRKVKKIRSDQGGEYSSNELKKFYENEGIIVQYTAAYSPQQNGVAERRNRYLIEMAKTMLLDSNLDKCYWAEAVNRATYLQNILPSSAVERTPHELWTGEKPRMDNLKVFGCLAEVHIARQKRLKLDDKSKSLVFVGQSADHKAFRFLNPKTGEITISRDAVFMEDRIQEVASNIPVKHLENEVYLKFEESSEDEDSHGSESDTESSDAEEELQTSEEIPVDPNSTSSQRKSERLIQKSRVDYRESIGLMTQREKDPQNFKEAVNSLAADKWKKAMEEEMSSIRENETWDLVELPPGMKTIGSKWIYKQKEDANGVVIRHKARLVALGCFQKFGRDYDEVFAPVVKQVTFRTLLTISNQRKLNIQHLDIKTAYLYGELPDPIYMRQPPGFEAENKKLVCRLKKSIYGLKQAARVWNIKIDSVLKKIDFQPSSADPCLYIKNRGGKLSFILIYVDDLVTACENEMEFQEIVKFLQQNFRITELGELKFFLGIQVLKVDGFYALNQKAFIHKLLERFMIADAKTAKIPMDPGYAQQKEEEPFENQEIYQSLIGSLLYLSTNTRPDIAICTSMLGRKTSSPTKLDWTEGKRVLKYLKGTIDHSLVLKSTGCDLECFVDADWASDATDRKSNSGFLIKLGGSTIEWSSKKQKLVSLSSSEAEFIALAECCQELLWILKLMDSFGVGVKSPIKINEDNQSCIKIAEKQNFERRSKHIETKFNFVKDLITTNKIKLIYCPTEEMIADILTKPLQSTKIQKFRAMMGMQEIDIEEEC